MIATEVTKSGGSLAAKIAKTAHGFCPIRVVIILNIDYGLFRGISLIWLSRTCSLWSTQSPDWCLAHEC